MRRSQCLVPNQLTINIKTKSKGFLRREDQWLTSKRSLQLIQASRRNIKKIMNQIKKARGKVFQRRNIEEANNRINHLVMTRVFSERMQKILLMKRLCRNWLICKLKTLNNKKMNKLKQWWSFLCSKWQAHKVIVYCLHRKTLKRGFKGRWHKRRWSRCFKRLIS